MIPPIEPPPYPLLGFSIERADKARVWHAVKDDAEAAVFLRSFGATFGELAVGTFTVDGAVVE